MKDLIYGQVNLQIKNIESELNKIIENSGKGVLIPYKSEAAGLEKAIIKKL